MKRHPTTDENPAPTQTNIPLRPEDLADPERLILVAREHFATGFPNDRNVDCPAPGVIRAASWGQMPGEELRAHLFRCSKCFNEYRAAIRDHYQQTASGARRADRRTKLMDALSRWRLPALACATALLFLAASLFIRGLWRTASPQSDQTRSQPAEAASAVTPLTPKSPALAARPPENSGQQRPRPAEALAIRLDLNRFDALGAVSRGGSRRGEGAKIKLPPRRALLKLRFREGSEAGHYRVSIVDPNSQTLVEAGAHSSDGKSLDAILDLRRAAQWGRRLRVERDDDLNEYLIEIAYP